MAHSWIKSSLCAATVMSVVLSYSHAYAKSNFMQECSTRYQAAKANGSVPADTKWNDFMKTKCADLKSSPTDASASASQSQQSPQPAATAATTAKKPGNNGVFMKTCSATWAQMKDAKEVPAGLTWKEFVKAGCTVEDSASKTEEATVPVEPKADKTASSTDAVPSVDKIGKAFTAGQIALHQRIRECGSEWKGAKASNSVPAGQTWPKFWSACNTRLKEKQG